MSKLINLGTVSEETKSLLYYSVNEDGKVQCSFSPNPIKYYRKSDTNGSETVPACNFTS